ncbi:serine/threonine protein kinase [Paracoccus halophilus]|uniref:Serine/threonine protein kinase n=1 Tax=Paracoccus halophilus TaxID=376733 RepID=A0A1I0TJD7_9RHOB|nr:serine/threonine-protein kinase [Paracoccus halophilus]SFA51911.1 serine/threonine protein kinase [Paracoccus halophilus]
MSNSDADPPSGPGAEAAERTVIADAVPAATGDRTILDTEPEATAPRLVEQGALINNNYRILSLVSAGGMGEVYRAENVFTGDPVAVKVILPNLARDRAVLDLFRREARVLVQLRDEAIVRYHNFVLDQGLDRYCLIMEFVEGRHLGKRLQEDGPLSEPEVIALLRRIGAGLHHAHAAGVTHRDLSPDNVILRHDRVDEAVLIDFGIARSTELGDGLEGRFAGKFKYIAPEQLGHAGGEIGPRTDVYGLGLLIAAVARGTALDMGDSVVSASAARQSIPDLTGISHRLFPLLQHMLEPAPAARPPDMGVVLRMLDDPSLIPARYRLPLWQRADGDAVTGGASASPFAGLSAPPAPTRPEAPPEAAERVPRALWAAGAAAAIALAGGLLWWQTRPAPVPPSPDPAPVAVAGLVARNPTTREGFLASQPLPPCTLATRLSEGPRAGMIALVSAAPFDSAGLIAAYEQAFGTRPGVLPQAVNRAQCPAVDFLREVAGRPAPAPELRLDTGLAGGRLQMRGSVSVEPGRSLWLFLVAPTGEIYDLNAQLAGPDQAVRGFGFALSDDAGGPAGPYLLAALVSDQPLTQVAATPSGVAGAQLLPAVLGELRESGANPAVAFRLVRAQTGSEGPAPN